MKKIKFLLLFNILVITTLNSCGTIKEGFSMQKKNNTDEFLVEKKNPLKIPPDFENLPVPKTYLEKNRSQSEDEIKKLISKNEGQIDGENNKNVSTGKSLEESLLEKIKKN